MAERERDLKWGEGEAPLDIFQTEHEKRGRERWKEMVSDMAMSCLAARTSKSDIIA